MHPLVCLRHDVADLRVRLAAGETVRASEVIGLPVGRVGRTDRAVRFEIVELVAELLEHGRDAPTQLSIGDRIGLVETVRAVAPSSLGGLAGNPELDRTDKVDGQVRRAHLMALISFVVATVVIPVDGTRELQAVPERWAPVTAAAARAALTAAVEAWRRLGGPATDRTRSAINLSGHVLGACDDAADVRRWKVGKRPIDPAHLLPRTQGFPSALLVDAVRWLEAGGTLDHATLPGVLLGQERPHRGHGLRSPFSLRVSRAVRAYRSSVATGWLLAAVLIFYGTVIVAASDLSDESIRWLDGILLDLARHWQTAGTLATGLLAVMATIGIAAAVLVRGTRRPAPEAVAMSQLAAAVTFVLAALVSAVIGGTVVGLSRRAVRSVSVADAGLAVLLGAVGAATWMIAVLMSGLGRAEGLDLRERQRWRRVHHQERVMARRPLAAWLSTTRTGSVVPGTSMIRPVLQRLVRLPAMSRIMLLLAVPTAIIVVFGAVVWMTGEFSPDQAQLWTTITAAGAVVAPVVLGFGLYLDMMCAETVIEASGSWIQRILTFLVVAIPAMYFEIQRWAVVSAMAEHGGSAAVLPQVAAAAEGVALTLVAVQLLRIPTAVWQIAIHRWCSRSPEGA